ncbi:hypothetical protein [Aeromonas veronii]|uniref:hypothetical protein n=1 Tax=Aeromonas veronii TaxID=654 RepID=UPI001F255D3A|nr:hypothetical protein [Aeromonas veronii]MCF5912029.1 hypothetical protein [Aeromonas veronii]
MSEDILMLVRYDVISLMKVHSKRSNKDESILDRKTLHSIRRKTIGISEMGVSNIIEELVENNKSNSKDILLSNRVRQESLFFLLVESSIAFRKVIWQLTDRLRDFIQEDSIDTESSPKTIQNKAYGSLPLDIIFSYIHWYDSLLEGFFSKDIGRESQERHIDTLYKFNNDIEKFEHRANVKYVMSEVSTETGAMLSNMKSDITSFINQSLVSVSEKITENTMDATLKISEFKELITEFKDVRRKQSEYLQDINLIHEYCETRKKNIDSVFVAANREGMAKSFLTMAEGLRKPMIAWASVFVIALVAITFSGFYIENEFSQIKNLNELWVAGVFKIMIITPLIWLAWFSGRQYNHTSKLRQDYSYKSAVAMAYQGYKEEATESGTDMHGKLLWNIVEHFSDNPVRLYEKQDSSSPLEEIIKKLPQEKLSEIIKSIKG